jgi:chromosome partitioning protein
VTTYAVALSKGGSTKTTTAAEVVAHLTRAGRRVLAIDLDEQGNLTRRLGVAADTEIVGDSSELLTGKAEAAEIAVPSPTVPGAHVIVGTHQLADVERLPEIVAGLRDYLPTLAGEWDDIVLDTPPALGSITLAALAAADQVIAAVACRTESYDQLDRLIDVITQRVAPRLRPGQKVHWIVPGQFEARQLLDREVVDLLNERFPGQVTEPIRKAVAAADAYTAGMPVSLYEPGSAIAEDYRNAMRQITGRDEEGAK